MLFSIKDTGIGMAPEIIDKLFKPFTQADFSTTRKFGGTGLGLYISKLLSEKMGGNIKVSSQPNVGSHFEVLIPTGSKESRMLTSKDEILLNTDTNKTAIPELRGKILLAEDSIDNQKLISLFIEDTGVSVTIVNNGREAVEKGLAEEFDLILMDMQMPEMDGIEAVKQLRSAGCITPISMLTANAMKENITYH